MFNISFDLFSTLLASFTILFIGSIIYLHDRKSTSNVYFFLISISTVLWSVANYFSLTMPPPQVLWWIRGVLFFAAPHTVFLALFVYNFPARENTIRKKWLMLTLGVLAAVMLLTLSPYVFSSITIVDGIVKPVPGPAMPAFAIIVLGALVFGWIEMIRDYRRARPEEKNRWQSMMVGVFTSYFLLILTNFLFVILFNNTSFVKYGAAFMLPAIAGMGYAIVRHHVLNVKTIATEVLIFILLSVSMFEVITSPPGTELLIRLATFVLLLVFGILLDRSVLREVKQREKLELLTKELQSANEKLKELDKLKSQYLSFASHQVKAPMTAVKGFATLISDGTYGPVSDKVRDAAIKIKSSADRMIQLVNNILNVRKIEEGKMEYKFETKDVAVLLEDVVQELQSLAKNKGLELSFVPKTSNSMAAIDEQNFRQVLQNIIENAIKYTDKGFVRVSLTDGPDDSLIISVTDSGRGISAQALPKLFGEYQRDAGVVGTTDGTGLGLYIANKIIQAHKGKVTVESPGEGKGTTFSVKLPRQTIVVN